MAVTAASCDDGTYAADALCRLDPAQYPRLAVVFGDSKYNNAALDAWVAEAGVPYRIEVTSKPEGVPGFVPVKIRWVAEQGIACLNRYRRLSKDYEYTTASSERWVQVAAVQRMVYRLEPTPLPKRAPFRYRSQPTLKA